VAVGIAIRKLIVWIIQKASPATQGLARWCAISLVHVGQITFASCHQIEGGWSVLSRGLFVKGWEFQMPIP